MLYKYALVLLISFSISNAFAQNYSYQWDKTFGGDAQDWNCSIVNGSAGTVFLIGDSETDVDGDKTIPLCNVAANHSDVWLIKADTNGTIIWQRDFGGESDDRSPNLILLNNPAQQMIFSCYSTSDIACDKSEPNRDTVPLISADYWIALLDSNGVIIWEKTLGGDNYDDYTKIVQLSTGEILVCGESNSPVGFDKTVPNHSISNDLWAVKLDTNGNVLADYVYGGDDGEFLTAVIADDQGGFLLAGYTNSDMTGDVSQATQGNLDFWMIKVDNLGIVEWDKRFGGTGPDLCNHAIRTADNGYLLCGFTVSPQGGDVSQAPKGFQDYWVVKTDSVGNKEWDKRFGGSNGSFGTHATAATNGGGYWISGYSNSTATLDVTEPTYGGSDYWVLKIDSVGNKLFDKRFGGSGNEFGTSLKAINDSTFMVFGYSDSGGSVVKNAPSKGFEDYWLVRFSYSDTTTSLKDLNEVFETMKIYPNPASSILYISADLNAINEPFSVQLHDVVGRLVYQNSEVSFNGQMPFSINTSIFKAGIYTLTVENQNHQFKSFLVSIY